MATNIKPYPNLIDGTWKTWSANTFKERGQAAMDFYIPTKISYITHG
jgi:hypothetical protein